jgi:hypothetical protein
MLLQKKMSFYKIAVICLTNVPLWVVVTVMWKIPTFLVMNVLKKKAYKMDTAWENGADILDNICLALHDYKLKGWFTDKENALNSFFFVKTGERVKGNWNF